MMDNVKEDLRTHNIDIRDVTDLTRDRTVGLWMNLVYKLMVSLHDGRERRRRVSEGSEASNPPNIQLGSSPPPK